MNQELEIFYNMGKNMHQIAQIELRNAKFSGPLPSPPFCQTPLLLTGYEGLGEELEDK